MEIEFGLKELTDITLKATYPIEVEGRAFEEGEVIARFDKIQLANFTEIIERTSANGGFDNRNLVTWESTKEVQFSFSQGIFSKKQLALLNNANLIQTEKDNFFITQHESVETNEKGEVKLAHGKIRGVFCYSSQTGKKEKPIELSYEKGELTFAKPYQNLEIDYEYQYQNNSSIMVIGQKLIKGYLQFEGRTKVKDDITGQTHSAILRIPRIRLMSGLSMRLGRAATPIVSNFTAIGVPTGERGKQVVMELFFLEDDIDADI